MSRTARIARTTIVVVGLCAASRPVLAADFTPWTQYQADAAHAGYIPVTIDPAHIQPLWTQTATQLGTASFMAGAVTDANGAYVISPVGDFTFHLVSLNRDTGAPQWTRPIDPYDRSSVSPPAVANGEVYVHAYGHSGISGGDSSQNPRLLGFNASTGTPNIDAPHEGQWSSGSRPTVDGSQVFAAGGYFGGLDAYNASTGARQWFANVSQQYGWIPAADATRVYVYMGFGGDSPGPRVSTLYAFNRSSGNLDFSIQNPTDLTSFFNGTLALGGQNDAITVTGTSGTSLTSFDLLTHSVRWNTPGPYATAIAIHDGVVYAHSGDHLDLLDEATGQLLSSWTAPDFLTGNVVVTDDLVFAHTQFATYAINLATLTTAWSTNTAGDLTLDSDTLFITSTNSITAFALPEPSSLSLLACTALPLLRRRRR